MLWSSSFPGTRAGRSTRRNILVSSSEIILNRNCDEMESDANYGVARRRLYGVLIYSRCVMAPKLCKDCPSTTRNNLFFRRRQIHMKPPVLGILFVLAIGF